MIVVKSGILICLKAEHSANVSSEIMVIEFGMLI